MKNDYQITWSDWAGNVDEKNVFGVENTENGWAEFQKTILWNIKEGIASTWEEIVVWTRINPLKSTEENQPTDDILNLQYFFPTFDFLKANIEELTVKLVVFCNPNINSDTRARTDYDTDTKPDSDFYRTRYYLFIQNQKRLKIATATWASATKVRENDLGKPEDDVRLIPLSLKRIEIGALFPLIRVGETESEGSLLLSELNNKSDYFGELIAGYGIHKGLPPPPLGLDSNSLLNHAGWNQLNKALESIKGTQEKPMKQAEKNRLKEDLLAFIQPRLKHLARLTQLIWIYLLCYLSDQKELIMQIENAEDTENNGNTANAENTKYREVDKWKLEYSYWNAIAYGEGILQLLENSCQHSPQRAGYLSLIIHNISLRQNARQVETAKKRERIFRRYRKSPGEQVLDLDLSCCLEFNVMDAAFDDEGKPVGIIRTKASNMGGMDSIENSYSQGDIFDTTQSSQELTLVNLFEGWQSSKSADTLHHYGMPLFRRNVLLNGGRFICITPDPSCSPIARYMAFSIPAEKEDKGGKSGEESFYKIEFDHYTFSHPWCTTYRILLPVAFHSVDFKRQAISSSKKIQLLDRKLLTGWNQTDFKFPTDFETRVISVNEMISYTDVSGEKFLELSYLNQKDKICYAEKLAEGFKKVIKASNKAQTVFVLDFTKISRIVMEILAKGLFGYFSDHEDQGIKRYFRLLFDYEETMCEFIRLISVFYNNSGQNAWMENIQLALCFGTNTEIGSPVKLIIAGKNLDYAYATARNFAYFNEHSLRLLSQIKYLTRFLCLASKKYTTWQ